jgi:hypothetical protein
MPTYSKKRKTVQRKAIKRKLNTTLDSVMKSLDVLHKKVDGMIQQKVAEDDGWNDPVPEVNPTEKTKGEQIRDLMDDEVAQLLG